MKKTLLLLVAAVLAVGLVISCAQPATNLTVTLKPDSAEAVADASTIVSRAIVNSVLVTWPPAVDSVSYVVFRREVNDDGPIESTFNQVNSTLALVGTSTIKKIPYFLDNNVENGVKYQYGIATQNYKNDSSNTGFYPYYSDIVWQEETDASKFVTAKVAAKGLVDIPTAPTYTIAKIDSTAAVAPNPTNYVENFFVTFSGLVPGYTYALTAQACLDANATTPTWQTTLSPGGANSGTVGQPSFTFTIANYVDNDYSVEYSTIITSGAVNQAASDTSYTNYGYRITATYALPASSSTLPGWAAGDYVIKGHTAVVLTTSTPGSVAP
jgi:hypothetical protein